MFAAWLFLWVANFRVAKCWWICMNMLSFFLSFFDRKCFSHKKIMWPAVRWRKRRKKSLCWPSFGHKERSPFMEGRSECRPLLKPARTAFMMNALFWWQSFMPKNIKRLKGITSRGVAFKIFLLLDICVIAAILVNTWKWIVVCYKNIPNSEYCSFESEVLAYFHTAFDSHL